MENERQDAKQCYAEGSYGGALYATVGTQAPAGKEGAGCATNRAPRRAAVLISNERLARLLNLRDGIEIVSGNYNPRIEAFEFFLSGGSEFPAKYRRLEICNVPIGTVQDWD